VRRDAQTSLLMPGSRPLVAVVEFQVWSALRIKVENTSTKLPESVALNVTAV